MDLIKRANFFRMYGIDRAVEWPAGTNGERGEPWVERDPSLSLGVKRLIREENGEVEERREIEWRDRFHVERTFARF